MRPRIKKSDKIFTTNPVSAVEEEVLRFKRFEASQKQQKPKSKYYFLFGIKKLVKSDKELQVLKDCGFNIIEE